MCVCVWKKHIMTRANQLLLLLQRTRIKRINNSDFLLGFIIFFIIILLLLFIFFFVFFFYTSIIHLALVFLRPPLPIMCRYTYIYIKRTLPILFYYYYYMPTDGGCDGYFGITDIVQFGSVTLWRGNGTPWTVTRQFSGSYDLTATKRTDTYGRDGGGGGVEETERPRKKE